MSQNFLLMHELVAAITAARIRESNWETPGVSNIPVHPLFFEMLLITPLPILAMYYERKLICGLLLLLRYLFCLIVLGLALIAIYVYSTVVPQSEHQYFTQMNMQSPPTP